MFNNKAVKYHAPLVRIANAPGAGARWFDCKLFG
jgi:hypothetical protein